MTDDATLLRSYLDGSQDAFAELVRCHIGAVYGTALRLVAGDAHLADDVTQKVFTDLARKASSLADRPVLLGWLYMSTQFEASKAVRSEQRWRNREQKAHVMQEIDKEGVPEPEWSELRPVIDSAMSDLKEADRDALLLRFFQSRSLAEVGQALGLSENAARMRVDLALEKLRGGLARRGIKSTAAALGTVMVGQLATAAPATLAATVTTAALAGTGTATGAAIVFMGMTKLQIGITAALAMAGGSFLWSEGRTLSKLEAENATLAQQTTEISKLKVEVARAGEDALAAAYFRKEASAVEQLRAEEKELLAALERKAAADAATAVKSDAKLYTLKELDRIPQARFRAQPLYPLELKKIGLGGEVLVELTIDMSGAVQDVTLIKSTHEALTKAVMDAVSKWKFEPGTKQGLPVNARLQLPFIFSLAHEEMKEWF
ncbi:MAG: TonB family protein [Nibricoccus sp.]